MNGQKFIQLVARNNDNNSRWRFVFVPKLYQRDAIIIHTKLDINKKAAMGLFIVLIIKYYLCCVCFDNNSLLCETNWMTHKRQTCKYERIHCVNNWYVFQCFHFSGRRSVTLVVAVDAVEFLLYFFVCIV